MHFILQSGDICASEKRAIRTTKPHSFIHFDDLAPTDSIPVGSVEFCTKFLQLLGKQIPEHLSYPESLKSYLKREMSRDLYRNVPVGWFVKPVEQIKAFTGHLKGSSQEPLQADIDDVLVWHTPKIDILAEWRFYVCERHVLGSSRYDDADEEYSPPPESLIQNIINDFIDQPIAYAIDVGWFTDQYGLIEINDAWSLGYYRWGDMTPANYASMIEKRWMEIISGN